MLTPTFYALEQHSHAVFNPIINKSEMMLPESFSKTPAESFTMLGDLNRLLNEKGEKSVGQFVENTIQQALIRHSVSMFEKLKPSASNVLGTASALLIFYCMLVNMSPVPGCLSLFTKVHVSFQNPPLPQNQEAKIEMPQLPPSPPARSSDTRIHREASDIPSVFYRAGALSNEFREVNSRCVLSNCHSSARQSQRS